MATQTSIQKTFNAIEEIHSTGKVSGQAFRVIKKAMETTDDIELIKQALHCTPVAWLALNKVELPQEALRSVLMEGNPKARSEALKSKHGAYMLEHFIDDFESIDFTAIIGSKHLDLDTHHELMDRLWVKERLVFIDSRHLIPLDFMMIAKAIMASDLTTIESKIGVSKGYGMKAVWDRLLDNECMSEQVVRELFELKDYYCDSALMSHRKTPQDLKDEIKQIMDNHHSKLREV